MNGAQRLAGQMALAAVAAIAAACSLSRRSGGDENGVESCPAPATTPTWTWRTERLGDVSIEVPTSFVEHLTGDPRARVWRDGPREIALRLTSDAHATRRVPHLVNLCELEVGDRVVEVAESRPEGSTRALLAMVPSIPGGPNLLVSVQTPYYKEFDALRRAVSSLRVGD